MALLEPPQDLLKLLRESLPEEVGNKAVDENDGSEEILAYVAFLAAGLTDAHEYDASVWEEALEPYLSSLVTGNKELVETFRQKAETAFALDDASLFGDDDDDAEELCDLRFNLAYGGKILLHQTRLKLLRGHRYALVGQNGVGKTTLMSAINNGKLDGWPSHLKTAYVDSGSNVDPKFEEQMMLPYLVESTGRSEEDCVNKLKELDFTDQMMKGTIGALSGGWQMKHRLVRAVLMDPDIYLMDEPTNHLHESAVKWLTDYLLALSHQTVLCVSHDVAFLDNICTDVIHYENREQWGPYNKLVHYKGNMEDFAKHPQSKNYFRELAKERGPLGNLNMDDDGMLKFIFPEPGRLDGIKTSTQKFIEMENVDFQYPGVDTNQLTNINLKMSLSSRVVVLGANGAGKTTLIKMIVGETVPSNLGGGCKFYIHPNVRVAYVAQHAFYHVEQHMEQSPVAYLQWRFKHGWDREKMESEGFKISEQEQAAIDAFGLEGIWSRRLRAGKLEYEVKKTGVPEKDNKYYSKDDLLAMGFEKLLKQTDEKIASKEAGLDLRPVTTSEIQKHLDGFGLEQEFGTYGKIRGLSGGQKVKLVLASAFWTVPHLVVLDEPTNFLDREALGALSLALNRWGGAVLMISHSKEFYSSVCKEEWNMANGTLTIEGYSEERAMKAVARKKKFEKELDNDEVLEKAGGNMNSNADKYKDATTNFWGQTVSKKEARQYDKAKKKGDIALMRKILQVPAGKVMPGYEELGDGKK
ncbi:[NU+] prion formation protein 1 [Seminavis robusta]|uniref:[NU+] prion formation protein 1 n=1 Tax=Seminavis robusta TaxID=568900 RepID=A0A9N8EA13_9STRA|nr:[NU+] prion formation protein 1 [Seminavis robusta]|eukprot:Sro672_g185120.1 [NU+] prion formation protein 1 (753) ;mRNA; r:43696-46403